MHLQYILMIKHHFRITDLKMHPLVKLRMLQTSKKKKTKQTELDVIFSKGYGKKLHKIT